MPPEISTISVNGSPVHVRRMGKGPPVLFLHGMEGVPAWLPFFDALAADHELWVPDHPGFGDSGDPPEIRNMSDLTLFYLDFMEQQGMSDVHVVGHSMGGWLAAEIAVRDRSRFKSLALIDAAGIRVSNLPPSDVFIWRPDEVAKHSYHDQSFADVALKNAAAASDEERERAVKNRFAAAKYCWQPRLYGPDLEKWLHRIKLDALVIWGREDKIFPPQYADLWKQRLPRVELEIFDHCGHYPFIEKAKDVAARLHRFWRTAKK